MLWLFCILDTTLCRCAWGRGNRWPLTWKQCLRAGTLLPDTAKGLFSVGQAGKVQGQVSLEYDQGLLSSTGKRLAAAAGELDITSLDEAGFEDIYWLVLEGAESTS